MFEARMTQGSTLKKVIEAIKDLVETGNLECATGGITLQAMDSSHVSLVALQLKADGFDAFRCDRNISLGLNMTSLSKILKCAGNDDAITLTTDDEADSLSLLFEEPDGVRMSEFALKLMDIDGEHLGIPETEYKCVVKMPSGEFKRIVTDLQVLGDTAVISVSKDGVKFSVKGDLGTGSVLRKQDKSGEKDEDHTEIEMEEATELTFALRYLTYFTKATPLSASVTLHLSKDVPLMVEYKVESMGYMRYYLAPKIDEESS